MFLINFDNKKMGCLILKFMKNRLSVYCKMMKYFFVIEMYVVLVYFVICDMVKLELFFLV